MVCIIVFKAISVQVVNNLHAQIDSVEAVVEKVVIEDGQHTILIGC